MKSIFSTLGLIILVALYKQFDLEQLQFKNIGLAVVYAIGLSIAIYAVVKEFRKAAKK